MKGLTLNWKEKNRNKIIESVVMKTIITSFVLSLFIVIQVFPQKYWERRFKTYNNPDELVRCRSHCPLTRQLNCLVK